MSVIMDNRINSSEKDEEVKRLQELVKKLELQNHELRTERQAILTHAKSTGSLNIIDENNISNFKNRLSIIENVSCNTNTNMEASLTSLDLAEINISDDETWLVNSPKTKPQLMKWIRKDVEDPSIQMMRKTLTNRIEELGGSEQSSPRHSIYSPGSSSGILSPESPPSREIDTRTFVRPKKRQSLLFNSPNGATNGLSNRIESKHNQMRSDEVSCEYLSRSNGSLGSEEDRLSSASDGSYSSFRLTDVEDVNTLARLQEESLKLPEPRPLNRLAGSRTLGTPRGCGAFSKTNVSEYSGGSSQEDLLANVPSPRRPSKGGLQAPRKYQYSGLPQSASRESSDLSSPPDSPYNSQHNLVYSTGRRLPSLTRRVGTEARIPERSPVTSRGASPLPTDPTEPRAMGRMSRLQAPQTRTSQLSAPSPARYPTGSPMSTDLPRAASRLKAPKATQLPPDPNDWREGCY